MKPYTYALLAAAAMCGLAAAETAYTTPVGYVSLGDTTIGQPAVKANTDVAVSVPLHRPVEFAGAVSATTANTITVSGATWTANQWAPGAADPYLVAVKSGVENGFLGLVTSNTADTLTVVPVTAGNLTSLDITAPDADTIQIYKAWTLITMFPSGSVPTGTRILAFTGTASGINLAPNLVYVWNGTAWQQITGAPGGVQNNAILYPGESFIVRAAATQVATLTVTGEVPLAKSRVDIAKLTAGVAQDNRISYFSPVDEIIGQSGLSAAGINVGDRLLGFNNNASGINKAPTEALVWTGTIWQGVTGVAGDQTNTYTLKGGRGYVFRRLNTAPVGNIDWKDEQSYVPSL